MTLPRHALASALRHVYTLPPAIRPIYTSIRQEGSVSMTPKKPKDKKEGLSFLSRQVRLLMRHYPHPLAAIVSPSSLTTVPLSKYRPGPNSNQQSALLVSSFNTVTLSPTPYVSFNIKTPSQTYRNIRDYGSFTVTGLEDPEVAQSFVEKNVNTKRETVSEAWRSAVVAEGGIVSPEYGGRWWIRCKYRVGLSRRVGDHYLVVGEVLEAGGEEVLEASGGEGGGEGGLKSGMVYLDGEYRTVGDRIEAEPETAQGRAAKRHEKELKKKVRWIEAPDARTVQLPGLK